MFVCVADVVSLASGALNSPSDLPTSPTNAEETSSAPTTNEDDPSSRTATSEAGSLLSIDEIEDGLSSNIAESDENESPSDDDSTTQNGESTAPPAEQATEEAHAVTENDPVPATSSVNRDLQQTTATSEDDLLSTVAYITSLPSVDEESTSAKMDSSIAPLFPAEEMDSSPTSLDDLSPAVATPATPKMDSPIQDHSALHSNPDNTNDDHVNDDDDNADNDDDDDADDDDANASLEVPNSNLKTKTPVGQQVQEDHSEHERTTGEDQEDDQDDADEDDHEDNNEDDDDDGEDDDDDEDEDEDDDEDVSSSEEDNNDAADAAEDVWTRPPVVNGTVREGGVAADTSPDNQREKNVTTFALVMCGIVGGTFVILVGFWINRIR